MSWAAVNPIIINWPGNSAPPRVKRQTTLAAAEKKGQILYLNSGVLNAVTGATGGVTGPYFRLCEDTGIVTTTDVWVQEIPDGAEAIIWCTNNGTDSAVAQANVGTKYGLYETGNVTYLDLNVTSNADWMVVDLMSLRDPIMHTVHAFNTAPGVCIARYVA